MDSLALINSTFCSDEQERRLKHSLLEYARDLGPLPSAVVQRIWAHNVLCGYDEARQLLLTLPALYPRDRLASACARALFYNCAGAVWAVRCVLERNLDRLPLSPYTDLYGRANPSPLVHPPAPDLSQTPRDESSK